MLFAGTRKASSRVTDPANTPSKNVALRDVLSANGMNTSPEQENTQAVLLMMPRPAAKQIFKAAHQPHASRTHTCWRAFVTQASPPQVPKVYRTCTLVNVTSTILKYLKSKKAKRGQRPNLKSVLVCEGPSAMVLLAVKVKIIFFAFMPRRLSAQSRTRCDPVARTAS